MEWLALLIPVVISLLVLLLFRHKIVWWESLIPIAISIILIMSCKFFMVRNLTVDTEYYSNYSVKATHYDRWNEWIEETCSSTNCDSDGKNCVTTYYDCSYERNHPEYWTITWNNGSEIEISEEKYNQLKNSWKKEYFVEMNRDYHTIDGDAQSVDWNESFNTLDIYDSSGLYSNKPQTAATVFHFDELNKADLKKVYDYPEIVDKKQISCLGCNDYDIVTLRKINGLRGAVNQIKIFVLVFENQPLSVVELQRQYWKGGNKNELVICVDSKSRWAKSFSWSDNKNLESKANQLFMNEHLTIRKKLIELNKLIPKYWKRKQFSDFNYIDVQLTDNQLISIFIVTFMFSIVCSYWAVVNDILQED